NRVQFVKSITGNISLSPSLNIKINRGWRDRPEIHTCFNSISLPASVATDKEDFKAMVLGAISGDDYNIA
ncbi:MAG: hypothetical protein P0S95_06560, partial [Rhabdochlamydiaceae bacterium]|nr:hypothetical protein [Candidatus Amphrikana amoebophyrae]